MVGKPTHLKSFPSSMHSPRFIQKRTQLQLLAISATRTAVIYASYRFAAEHNVPVVCPPFESDVFSTIGSAGTALERLTGEYYGGRLHCTRAELEGYLKSNPKRVVCWIEDFWAGVADLAIRANRSDLVPDLKTLRAYVDANFESMVGAYWQIKHCRDGSS